jgi:hypothetical protein
VIQSNLFTYLGILLEGREDFEEESLLNNRKRLPSDESTSSGKFFSFLQIVSQVIMPVESIQTGSNAFA